MGRVVGRVVGAWREIYDGACGGECMRAYGWLGHSNIPDLIDLILSSPSSTDASFELSRSGAIWFVSALASARHTPSAPVSSARKACTRKPATGMAQAGGHVPHLCRTEDGPGRRGRRRRGAGSCTMHDAMANLGASSWRRSSVPRTDGLCGPALSRSIVSVFIGLSRVGRVSPVFELSPKQLASTDLQKPERPRLQCLQCNSEIN